MITNRTGRNYTPAGGTILIIIIIIIMYCNNNFHGSYWVVVGPKLSGPHGDPDY